MPDNAVQPYTDMPVKHYLLPSEDHFLQERKQRWRIVARCELRHANVCTLKARRVWKLKKTFALWWWCKFWKILGRKVLRTLTAVHRAWIFKKKMKTLDVLRIKKAITRSTAPTIKSQLEKTRAFNNAVSKIRVTFFSSTDIHRDVFRPALKMWGKPEWFEFLQYQESHSIHGAGIH